jgi:antitoxin VapB
MPGLFTRVFNNGNSQAVRIPQEFRLDVSRVEISLTGDGDLLIHPIRQDRGTAIFEALAGFDPSFVAAVEDARREQLPTQERDEF